MQKNIIFSLLFSSLLIGCGNDSDDQDFQQQTPAQKISSLENSGEIPKLERTNTIAGIDGDKNGIRDDIDIYIEKTYPSEEQQKAVKQFAKALQTSLLVDKEDIIAVKSVTNVSRRAISCIFEKVPNGNSPNGGSVVEEILGATTNTKQRLIEYMALDKALDGTVISSPKGEVCDE